MSNLDKYEKDLVGLIKKGEVLLRAISLDYLSDDSRKELEKLWGKEFKNKFKKLKDETPNFKEKYQEWYSESQVVIKQLLPDRLEDFIIIYKKPKNRKNIDYENYVIEDCLHDLTITKGWEEAVVVSPSAAIPKFHQQLNILKSVQQRFKSVLFDIKQILQADLFDSELDAARELLKNKFFRAAGAISGVVLEKHLDYICLNHQIIINKKDPSINDLADFLKNNNVIEISQWRFIQHLSDLRNLCDHNKKREPKSEEVLDLIDGVDKISKTLFRN